MIAVLVMSLHSTKQQSTILLKQLSSEASYRLLLSIFQNQGQFLTGHTC